MDYIISYQYEDHKGQMQYVCKHVRHITEYMNSLINAQVVFKYPHFKILKIEVI